MEWERIMEQEKKESYGPPAICDVSLRDGFQTLFAGRGRTPDMVRMAAIMENIGFWAVDVWGGISFDVMHRLLNEDPWERLRSLRRYFRNTPMACTFRGQSLVGERNYADDVVQAFIERAAAGGISVFRLYDPLNDLRNLEVAARAVRRAGAHLQGCICYDRTAANPEDERLYTHAYYLEKLEEMKKLGAHSVCILDSSGLLGPNEVRLLITELRAASLLPLHLHTRTTRGLGDLTLFAAIEAGVDGVDTCIMPLAYRNSLPAVEPLIEALHGTDRALALPRDLLSDLAHLTESEILPKYWHSYKGELVPVDSFALKWRLPLGIVNDMKKQLLQANMENRLNDAVLEFRRVRKDLGNPPLMRPLKHMMAVQAVNNTLFDTGSASYRMVASSVRDYCAGLFGTPPSPLSEDLVQKALSMNEKLKSDSTRPGALLEPELPKIREEVRGLAADIEDELLCALFPATGKRFLRWKYGRETPPENTRARTLEEALKMRERMVRILSDGEKGDETMGIPEKSPYIRTFNVFVDDTFFEVGVDEVGGAPVIRHAVPIAPPREEIPKAQPVLTHGLARERFAEKPAEKAERKDASGEGTPLLAPMPGTIVSFRKKEGDSVRAGETVVILEAMKMENALVAPVSGTIETIGVRSGDHVPKDAVLCLIR